MGSRGNLFSYFNASRQGMGPGGASREFAPYLDASKQGMRACGVSRETASYLKDKE